MRAEVHAGALDPLLAEWADLFGADGEATPFLWPGWAAAWSRHLSGPWRPWVLAVRADDRLVGLAPFALRRRGPMRVISGLGTTVGNYWDFLARAEDRRAVNDLIVRHLGDRGSEWDALLLDRLPESSKTVESLTSGGLRIRHRPPSPYLGIELPETFDEYLSSLTSNGRSRLRRRLRALDQGEVSLREVRDPRELETAVERWQEMRSAWWTARGKAIHAEHLSDRFRAFTLDMVLSLVPAGLGLVWEFRRGGEVVGYAINFVDPRTFYYWLGAYDPRFPELSLGQTVIAHGIRTSIEAGRSYYDFMIGTEDYKYSYAPTPRWLPSLVVGNAHPRSQVALAASAAVDRSRQWRPWRRAA